MDDNQSDAGENLRWVPHPEDIWTLASVAEPEKGKVSCQTVDLSGGNKTTTFTLPESEIEERSIPVEEIHLVPNVNSLCQLYSSVCHEAPALNFIRNMWDKKSAAGVYVNVAHNILLALNPHAQRDAVYENPMRYCVENSTRLNAHIFTLCNSVLRSLFHSNQANTHVDSLNHSLIMHGDSGSGKTETSKIAAQWLTSASNFLNADAPDTEASKRAEKLLDVIRDSYVVLEAFGNAKTKANDNASRFGRYMKLQFTESNKLVSVYNETFGLEKPRLVAMTNGERNYHIFYQLFRGMGSAYPELKKKLSLQAVEQFRMLTNGNCLYRQHVQEDVAGFHASVKAMLNLGASEAEVKAMWTLLAVMLHLGNATCEQDSPDEQADIHIDTMPIGDVADLLGVSAEQFTAAMTTASLTLPSTASPNSSKPGKAGTSPQAGNASATRFLSKEEVQVNINGFLKHMYKGIYFWLVRMTNHAGAYYGNILGVPVKFIGITDVYGFEDKADNGKDIENSLEQLLINFVDERLKQQFVERIFVNELNVCAAEGLDTNFMQYSNNQHILDYINKKPIGVFPTLDSVASKQLDPEQLVLAFQESINSSTEALTSTPQKAAQGSLPKKPLEAPMSVKLLSKTDSAAKIAFTVTHFCGDTVYNLGSFVHKNVDGTAVDYTGLLSSSSNVFLKATLGIGNMVSEGDVGHIPWLNNPLVLPQSISTLKTKTIATTNTTVSSIFTSQLDTMMSNLRSTASHYVKCIRPNARAPQAERGTFKSSVVGSQLRAQGIYEAIFLTKTGFPERMDFREFYTQFEMLKHDVNWHSPAESSDEELTRYCTQIATNLINLGAFKIGRTKICLQDGVMDYLNNVVLDLKNANAAIIQSRWRGYSQQARYKQAVVVWRQKKATAEFAKSLFDNDKTTSKRLARAHNVNVDIFAAINSMKDGSKSRSRASSPGVASMSNIFAPISADDNDKDAEHIKKLQDYYLNKMNTIRGFLRNVIAQRRIAAIFKAVMDGDSETVMTTLRRRPELSDALDKDSEFMTLRHAAMKSGNMDMVRLLGVTPVSICAKDAGDNAGIHYAALSPNLTLYKIFYRTLSSVFALPKADKGLAGNANGIGNSNAMSLASIRALVTPESPQPPPAIAATPPTSPANSPDKGKSKGKGKDKDKNSQGGDKDGTGYNVKKAGFLHKLNNSGRLAKRWVSLEKNRLKYWYTEPDKESQDHDYNVDEFRLTRQDCFLSRYSSHGRGDLFFVLNFSSSSIRKRRKKIIWRASSESDLQSWLYTLSQVSSFDRFRSYAPRYRNPQLCRTWLSQLTWARESVLHTIAHSSNIKLRKARRAFFAEDINGVHDDASAILEALKCAAWMIDHGCPLNQKNMDGQTALHVAIEGGNAPLAVLLVRKGAAIEVKDFKAVLPLDLCDRLKPETLGYSTDAVSVQGGADASAEGSEADAAGGSRPAAGASASPIAKKKVAATADVVAAKVLDFSRGLKYVLRKENNDYHRLQMPTKDTRLLPSSLTANIPRNPMPTLNVHALTGAQKKGYSYISMHIQKHFVERLDFMGADRIADIENFRSALKTERMCLEMGVYNGTTHQLLEPVQECEKPIYVNKDLESMWWGFNYFIQTPLEFFPDVTYIKFKFYLKDVDTRLAQTKGAQGRTDRLSTRSADYVADDASADTMEASVSAVEPSPSTKARLTDIDVSQACYLIDMAAVDSGTISLSLRDVKDDNQSSSRDSDASPAAAPRTGDRASTPYGTNLALKSSKRGGTSQSNLEIDMAINEYFDSLSLKDILMRNTDSVTNYAPGCYVNNPPQLFGAAHDKLQNKNKRGLAKQMPVVFALSYFEGASSERFHFTVPKYVKPGDIIKNVGGIKNVDFQVPTHVKGGQSVIMVVPSFIKSDAAVGLPEVKADDFTPNRSDIVRLQYTLPHGSNAGQYVVQNTDGSCRLQFQVSEALIASLDAATHGLPIVVVFNATLIFVQSRTRNALSNATADKNDRGTNSAFSKFLIGDSGAGDSEIKSNSSSESDNSGESSEEAESDDELAPNDDAAANLYKTYETGKSGSKVEGTNPMRR